MAVWIGLEISVFFAIVHGGVRTCVIDAASAFGDTGGGDFGDDVIHVAGR
jgi:hypothetical protein